MPEYEVVVCTYNGARFLPAQLESLMDQSHPPARVSMYDDCSTDETVKVAEQLFDKARERWKGSFVIRCNPRNLGYALNFQQGLERANKGYVFLCDQDDIWTSDKAETLLRLARLTGADLVFSDGVPIDEHDQTIGNETVLASYGLGDRAIRRFNNPPFDFLVRRNYVNGAAAAIRRDSARSALPVPKGVPHDYWLALWATAHGGIACSPARLYGYRQHGNNAIGLGVGGVMDHLRSAWRYPVAPRERELYIWRMVASRIDDRWSPAAIRLVQRKLDWMTARFAAGDSSSGLLLWILVSVLCGQYARLSIGRSILRDVAALLRSSLDER